MGRYLNWVLIVVGLAAGAILTAEGTLRTGALSTELLSLLCVVAAVPPVIAAIRIESTRKIAATTSVVVEEAQRLGDRITGEISALGDRLEQALTQTSQAHAEQMKAAVVQHGERLGKGQLEAVTGTLAGMLTQAQMEKADRRAAVRWTDTGPFRIPQ